MGSYAADRGLKAAIAATFAACVVVAAVGAFLVLNPGGADAGESAPELHRSSKLEGAAETVDGNGVVHGTSKDGVRYILYGRGRTSADVNRVTLAAVGDVVGSEQVLDITDANNGPMYDGVYDFNPYYQDVKPLVNRYDLRFINQETVVDNQLPIEVYPEFNSPDSIVEAWAQAGFNIVNFNSNHSWDMGSEGIEQTRALLATYPGIMTIGTFESQDDREVVRMVECNGATIAFLSYNYGVNGHEGLEGLPNSYYSCLFDKDAMSAEIARAKQVADAVVVYMHWGSEYDHEPNEQQWDYAQFLADQGVDLVIGSHAHILQPIRYVTGAGGNTVLVVFGLSDFVCGWTLTYTILSGVFTCDFVWEGDELAVEAPAFYPAIEWGSPEGGNVRVRLLHDMTADEINVNTQTPDVEDDWTYLHDFIAALEMDVPVVW